MDGAEHMSSSQVGSLGSHAANFISLASLWYGAQVREYVQCCVLPQFVVWRSLADARGNWRAAPPPVDPPVNYFPVSLGSPAYPQFLRLSVERPLAGRFFRGT